jgi:hypothetical protein
MRRQQGAAHARYDMMWAPFAAQIAHSTTESAASQLTPEVRHHQFACGKGAHDGGITLKSRSSLASLAAKSDDSFGAAECLHNIAMGAANLRPR